MAMKKAAGRTVAALGGLVRFGVTSSSPAGNTEQRRTMAPAIRRGSVPISGERAAWILAGGTWAAERQTSGTEPAISASGDRAR